MALCSSAASRTSPRPREPADDLASGPCLAICARTLAMATSAKLPIVHDLVHLQMW